jgi:DNA (cytosine-5)-methyltransferase 1
VAGKGAGRDGERGQLVDEVMRWTDALRPRWVACEQVPPVLPIWREFAHRMEGWGYRTWCGLLSSERYGVPQTRERAILMASLDFTPQPPAPTHQEYHHGEPARREVGLFGDLEPWVSMAEALGWGMTERPSNSLVTRASGGGGSGARKMLERERGAWVVDRRTNSKGPGGTMVPTAMHGCDTPAPTVDSQAGSRWVLRGGAAEHATVRPAPAPAPTILGNVGKNGGWVWERPATTIAGDPRCFQPGGHHEPGQQSENAIRLTLPEGLILQGFPPDYPVQGTKTSQWLQVGNAIPPPLAKAILAQLVPAREAAT